MPCADFFAVSRYGFDAKDFSLKRVRVAVKRDTRWDVYPSQAEIEYEEIVIKSIRYIGDCLAKQTKWRYVSPLICSVEELEGPIQPFLFQV